MKTKNIIVIGFILFFLFVCGVCVLDTIRRKAEQPLPSGLVPQSPGGSTSSPPDPPFLLPTHFLNYDGDIHLYWEATKADSFTVYRSKDGGSFVSIATIASTSYSDRGVSASYSDGGLSNGIYRYKIIAHNIYGNSNYSNVISVTVEIPGVDPPAPIEPVPFGISPVNYLFLICGLGIGLGSFLVYKKTRKSKK